MKKAGFLFLVLIGGLTLANCGGGVSGAIKPEELTAYLETEGTVLPLKGQIMDWNLKVPLLLTLFREPVEVVTNKGKVSKKFLKEDFSVMLIASGETFPLNTKVVKQEEGKVSLQIEYPRDYVPVKDDNFYIEIKSATLNKNIAKFTVVQDYHNPVISVVAQSDTINRGGAAMVIFEVRDENIADVYVIDNRGKIFYPQVFHKEGYYSCVIGWDLTWSEFKAWIVAKDAAGNASTNRVHFENQPLLSVTGKVDLKPSKQYGTGGADSFYEGEGYKKGPVNWSGKGEVKYIDNKEVEGQFSVMELTCFPPEKNFMGFNLVPFKPMTDEARMTSDYGQFRNYYSQGKLVKQSYHMGLDLTYYVNCPIYNTNSGTVIYSGYNGGFGNCLIVDYGMGIYGLYGHNSKLYYEAGDKLKGGEMIAKSGQTGMATGDHLHFSIFIQGTYVNPNEWMDQQWMNKNIIEVIDKAERILNLRW
ncbi:MAG: hypothetical protein A2Y33_01195 [Spirochaetes bacterium GWF1_51_8]|nr:MAG: hypothetical protein A2Y33_01195 [Spirochaetes bacterium GWF1_51_8]